MGVGPGWKRRGTQSCGRGAASGWGGAPGWRYRYPRPGWHPPHLLPGSVLCSGGTVPAPLPFKTSRLHRPVTPGACARARWRSGPFCLALGWGAGVPLPGCLAAQLPTARSACPVERSGARPRVSSPGRGASLAGGCAWGGGRLRGSGSPPCPRPARSRPSSSFATPSTGSGSAT